MKNKINSNQLENEVHIWTAILDQPEAIIDGYYSILPDNEQKMVDKYRTGMIRKRQIISKGLVRLLISRYMNLNPNEIKFYYNEFGKPFVSPDSDRDNIFFNLSHSDNIAVFIFSKKRKIGIDVEKIKELADMEGIVRLCFSESEKKWFNELPSTKKEEMFYKIWTSKEAYMKAIGKGFSFSPKRISLELRINDNLFFKEIDGDEDFNRWKLITFRPNPDFISSLVVEDENFIIEHFSLDPQYIFNHDIQILEK